MVRDIAVEHLKEDLNGKVPTLGDWLHQNDDELASLIKAPEIGDEKLKEFVLRPLIMSNLKSSLIITLSDFGIYLTKEVLGLNYAMQLMEYVDREQVVRRYLKQFRFTEQWQFSPDPNELRWLKTQAK